MTDMTKCLLLSALVFLVACGTGNIEEPLTDAPYDSACDADGSEVGYLVDGDPCDRLSSYGFFTEELAAQTPASGVIPYAINTPLFSDYSAKDRFIWMPEGTSAGYVTDTTFSFPVGTVLIKTFSFAHDLRTPEAGRRIIETRLLVHEKDGWTGYPYVWNDDQTEAHYRRVGAAVDVSWTHHDGSEKSIRHRVPNINDCKACHATDSKNMAPIGPASRYLDMTFEYSDGVENQLDHWAGVGYLSDLSAPADRPTPVDWKNAADFTIEERARTYLDINCAHCHNGTGQGRSSGLYLDYSEKPVAEMTTDQRRRIGVCKYPIASGQGSGGRKHVIVPGEPDESIFVYRLEATALSEMMPELGRSLVHAEGVELVREWVSSLAGLETCPE